MTNLSFYSILSIVSKRDYKKQIEYLNHTCDQLDE